MTLIHYAENQFLSINTVANYNYKDYAYQMIFSSSIKFLHQRFSRESFYGLTLTVLSITFICILLFFVGIIEDVVNSDPITLLDRLIAKIVVFWRTPPTTLFFIWVTRLAQWYTIILIGLIASLVFWHKQFRYAIISLWVATAGSTIFCLIAKYMVGRQRPSNGIYKELFFAFPSIHATVSITTFGFLAYFLCRQVKSWFLRTLIVFSAGFLILNVGISRIYLGVHYLSDVIGGYLLGLLWLIAGIAISEWAIANNKKIYDAFSSDNITSRYSDNKHNN